MTQSDRPRPAKRGEPGSSALLALPVNIRQRGFTLIEVAVVMVIFAVVIAMVAQITGGVSAARRATTTAARLDAVERDLEAFVMLTKRLPCPADGVLGSGEAGAGVERRDAATGDCLGAQARGVVPWVTLGRSEIEATDGFEARITYRVALGLTRNNAMDFSGCDPAAYRPVAGTWTAVGAAPYQACNPTCEKPPAVPAPTPPCCNAAWIGTHCTTPADVLSGRGLRIQLPGGTELTSAAAFVLISHGENRAGAYGAQGALLEASGIVGPSEGPNAADQPLGAFYVEALPSAIAGTYFDDLIRRPAVLAVATRAGLSPRLHD